MSKPEIVVRFYRMRNRLSEKAGGIGTKGALGTFPVNLIEQAQESFETMTSDYPDWVQSTLSRLTRLVETAKAHPDRRFSLFKEINLIAHDMKGQGGTFGYPLITNFGDSLYDFTGPNAGSTDSHVAIIKAHVDAMRATITARIQGDGGEIGQQLKTMLATAIKRYSS